MKKTSTIKVIVFAVIALTILGSKAKAQCPTIPPPTVSGNTLASCVSSSNFTLTASSSTNNTYWIDASNSSITSTNQVFVTPNINSSATYYVAQGNSATSASLNLPTYVSPYSGMTRGWVFQAPASFMITGVRVPTDIGTGNSSFAIMAFSSAPPAYPSVTNSFTLLASATNTPGTGIIPVNVTVNMGDYIGVLGCRDVSGTPNTSYSGATSPYATTFGSYNINLMRMGMQFPLPTNMPPHDLWTETGGTVARVELYTTIGCLSPMTLVTVSVSPAPQITLSGPPTGSICLGDSVVLSGSGIPFSWQVPGSPSTSTLLVSPSSSTTYFVSGTISPTCTASASITVNVNSNPIVIPSASQPVVCMGGGVLLSTTGNATSYQWSGGPATTNYPVNNLTTYTVFSVTGTDNFGCHTTSTIEIGVLDVQVGIYTSIGSSTICAGTSVTLTASGCDSYVWNGNNPPQAEIEISPNFSTNYIVTGTTFTTGGVSCSATSSISINVLPNPPISAIGSKTVVCKGEPVTLSAGGNAASYLWNNLNLTTKIININPSVVGVIVYTVTGTQNNNCTRTATVQLMVDACVGIEEQNNNPEKLTIYPNPSNGEFKLEMNDNGEKNIKLFDLTGRVLTTLKTIEKNIDFNINHLSNGVYYLQIQSSSESYSTKIIKE